MARFRRKRFRSKLNESQSTDTDNTNSTSGDNTNHLSTGDRKCLHRYLRRYKECIFDILRGRAFLPSDDITRNIFDKEFPALNLENFRKPYLSTPCGLSSKQRKLFHDMCVEIGIYHVSIGNHKTNKVIFFSVYCDGFEYISNDGCIEKSGKGLVLESQPSSIFSMLKPWALQRRFQQKFLEETNVGREAVLQLIDQPGRCLRDGIDFLDFQAMESEDLSKTTPPRFDTDTWMLVDTPQKVQQCVNELIQSGTTEIAFDLECYNKTKYMQVTCLLQLAASNGREYVIDPLAPGVWNAVHLLAPLFANPTIVKIGHSIGGLDVRSLHRDFGIFVVNAFDTYEAARCLGLPHNGLAKVCEYYGLPDCNVYESLKETYQQSDWTLRPLTEPMIRYGRYDVHYLIRLRKLMMRDLAKPELYGNRSRDVEAQLVNDAITAMLRKFDQDEEIFIDGETEIERPEDSGSTSNAEEGNEKQQQTVFEACDLRMNLRLMQAISRSTDRCLDLWTDHPEPALKNSEFQSLLVRCKKEGLEWTSSQLSLYEALSTWRSEVATNHQCPPDFVCSLGFLALVAFKRPPGIKSLIQVQFDLPAILKSSNDSLDQLFLLVRRSRIEDGLEEMEDPSSFPSYEQSKALLDADRNGVLDAAKALTEWSTVIGTATCISVLLLVAIIKTSKLRKER